MKSPQFSMALLHPRYYLTWMSLAALALTAQLPFRWQMYLGVRLGRVLFRVGRRRRHIAERNIALCFSELSAEQQQALVKTHFETNGVTLFEIGMAWFMPYWRLRKRFEVKGKAHWDRLQQAGQGALVIGLHFNTLEIINVEIDRLFNLSTSYRPHQNPVYNFVQYHRRRRHNDQSRTIDRYDMRAMVKTMKQGGFLWYAPDQDYGRRVSEFIPWFGIPAATLSATPRLLQLAKVPALGLSYRRLPDYSGYQVEFMPIIEGIPSGDDHEDLVRINQHIEACVRANPAEYLWVHRRFKTRPKGEASVY